MKGRHEEYESRNMRGVQEGGIEKGEQKEE